MGDNIAVIVTAQLAGIHNDKPILSALPGPVATTGGNMTLQCVSFGAYDKLILSKEDEKFSTSLDSQYIHHNGQYQAMFSVNPMTPLHIGTFRCYGYYKDAPQLWSVPSDPLEIHISGLSKKPLLLTHQGHILDPGMNLTLQCLSDINYDRFVLYKVGEDKLIQHSAQRTQAGLSLVNFTLGPVSNSTGGQYRCYGANHLSSEWSASSDPLDILISGPIGPSSPPPSNLMPTAGLERYLIGASVAFLLVMSILIFLLQRRRQRGKYKENAQKETELQLPAGAAEPVTRVRGSQKRRDSIYTVSGRGKDSFLSIRPFCAERRQTSKWKHLRSPTFSRDQIGAARSNHVSYQQN
ncbi:hypothetical protein STEG23_015758, partial [Scotinomys teguina]